MISTNRSECFRECLMSKTQIVDHQIIFESFVLMSLEHFISFFLLRPFNLLIILIISDIAVLTLETPIDFAAKSACACPLCLRRSAPAVGTTCLASGFGNEIDQKPNPRPDPPRPIIPLKITTAEVRPSDPANCLNGPGKDLSLWVCAGRGVSTGTCQGISMAESWMLENQRDA